MKALRIISFIILFPIFIIGLSKGFNYLIELDLVINKADSIIIAILIIPTLFGLFFLLAYGSVFLIGYSPVFLNILSTLLVITFLVFAYDTIMLWVYGLNYKKISWLIFYTLIFLSISWGVLAGVGIARHKLDIRN